jgi:hypothetical protein
LIEVKFPKTPRPPPRVPLATALRACSLTPMPGASNECHGTTKSPVKPGFGSSSRVSERRALGGRGHLPAYRNNLSRREPRLPYVIPPVVRVVLMMALKPQGREGRAAPAMR